MPELARLRPRARLKIIGSGPNESELRRLATALGVMDRVEITSIRPDERRLMSQELAGASLLVLLSDYEAHPLVVMEAVQAGTPALVCLNTGMTELVEAGLASGVATSADGEEVARAMDLALRVPRSVSATLIPTWDVCADSLASLYTAHGLIASVEHDV